jgi:hypothetical protein
MVAPPDEVLKKVYADAKTIAVVGASADESKASHRIPKYLQSQGYRIIPVSPKGGEIFGEKVAPSLEAIDVPVDVVDVFRPSEETPAIARDAVKIGAKVLWLQTGIHHDEAQKIAEEGGLTFVSGMCMGATHGRLGLGPGPH